MVVHVFSPRTQEAQAGGSEVQGKPCLQGKVLGQAWLHGETLFQTTTQKVDYRLATRTHILAVTLNKLVSSSEFHLLI